MERFSLLLILSSFLIPFQGLSQESLAFSIGTDSSAYFQQQASYYFDKAAKFSPDTEEAKKNYLRSAQYWQKTIEKADPITLKLYRNLAMAQYRGQVYQEADKTFKIIQEKKANYESIIRCFPSSSQHVSLIPSAEDVVKTWGDKTDQLSPEQLQTVLVAMEALALKAFDPVGNNDPKDYDCAAAKTNIDKIKALNPEYIHTRTGLKGIAAFCTQQ